MGDFLFILVPIFFLIFFGSAIVAVVSKFKGSSDTQKNSAQSRSFNREVDSIHITSDAATERRRRLDQLKSLYDAGMMEKAEYLERCEGVEADFNRGTRY